MIEYAKVTGVDPSNRTVTLLCTNTHRSPVDVPLLSSQAHPDHSGGDDYVPEIGAYCFVAFPSDKSTPFVLGYVNKPSYGAVVDDSGAVVEEPSPVPALSYSYNRAELDPGDRMFSTADGNHVILRRGGMVQVGATPLAQMMMIPIENVVRFYAQRFQLRSPLGEIDWGHTQLTNNGVIKQEVIKKTPVLIKYGIKEQAQENVTEHYTVELRVGQLDETTLGGKSAEHRFGFSLGQIDPDLQGSGVATEKGVISLVVHDNTNGSAATFCFQVNREGNLFVKASADIFIHARKAILSAEEIHALASDLVALRAFKIELGGDSSSAVLGESLLNWLSTHTHGSVAGPTTPPAVLPTTLLLSQKVKLV